MACIQQIFNQQGVYWYSTVRPVGYAFANELYIEKNYNFYSDLILNGGSGSIWITRKNHRTDASKKLYKIWYGTENNSSTTNYNLSVGANAVQAVLYTLNSFPLRI
jgi:hypothetical protein